MQLFACLLLLFLCVNLVYSEVQINETRNASLLSRAGISGRSAKVNTIKVTKLIKEKISTKVEATTKVQKITSDKDDSKKTLYTIEGGENNLDDGKNFELYTDEIYKKCPSKDEDSTFNVCQIYNHPYFVSIETEDGKHLCGGALINNNTVLTSAPCCDLFKDKQSDVVVITGMQRSGMSDQKSYIVDIRMHENVQNIFTDLCILKTLDYFFDTAATSFINLPTKPNFDNCTLGMVVGYDAYPSQEKGEDYSTKLRCAELEIRSPENCQRDAGLSNFEPQNMFCAIPCDIGKSKCYLDEGSPFSCDGKLYGIISHAARCREDDKVKTITRIGPYNLWIDENIGPYTGAADRAILKCLTTLLSLLMLCFLITIFF